MENSKELQLSKGKMDIKYKDMGKIVPMDVIDEKYSEEEVSHIVFLLCDERFKNKLVCIPGLLTFFDFLDAKENIEIYQRSPDVPDILAEDWRLLDIDEMEDFYDFFKNGGMGGFDEMIDDEGIFEYGTSDVEDIDNPHTSRIYSVDFSNGKRKSIYRNNEKMLIMIREISDEGIIQILSNMYLRINIMDFIKVSEKVSSVYPHLYERIRSIGDISNEKLKTYKILSRFI